MKRILLTTTSYQDTPGAHHALLESQGYEIVRERGREAATTFLAKAALAPQEMQVQEMLESAGAVLRAEQEKLDETLRQLDASLTDEPDPRPPAETLGTLASRAAFLGKWQAQLQAAWTSLFSAS